MTRYSLAVLMLLPCVVCAQEKKQEEQPRWDNTVTRMIRLEHANPQQVRNLLRGAGAQVYWDDTLRVVVVSGTPSQIASMERTVRDLDAEAAKITISNAELTVYVLGASQESGDSTQIPASLEKTANQIKSAFPYQSYRVLETVVARSLLGEQTDVSGTLRPFKDNPEINDPATYKVHFRLAGITTGPGRDVFHIQEFRFDAGFPMRTGTLPAGDKAKVPYATVQWQRSPASIGTNFDVSSNQQVVIGKAGVAGNSAVFLIVEAKAVK